MNNKNKILILVAVILTIIICAECRILFNDKETIVVTKNNDNNKSLDSKVVKVEDNSMPKHTIISKNEKKPTNRTKIWNGVKSRYEIKTQLDGTIWESIEVDPFTDRWLKFSINGNTVTQYYAERTYNYDDPKNWKKLFTWDIYKVLETEKGFYSIALKEKEGNFSYTFLFFRGKTVGFGWGEEGASTVLLKLV